MTIDEVLDERPLTRLQLRVVLLCALVVFIDGYDLQALALAVPSLSGEWGTPPQAFGIALSASMLGLGLGSAFLAPLGDRWGRKPVLIGCLTLIGVTTLATTLASDPFELAVWRVLTGVGLGACQANATALTSEYAPVRRRASLMTLMGCNVALGGVVAAFTAPWVIQWAGWQGIFLVGGTVPLVLALVVLLFVPESIRMLGMRRPDDPRIAAILRRLAPDIDPATGRPSQAAGLSGRSESPLGLIRQLLSPPFTERTLRLWLVYGFSAFLMYLVINWLPVLLDSAGWARSDALRGIALVQFGGIGGSLILAWLLDRGYPIGALTGAYTVAALATLAFVTLPPSGLLWSILLTLIGACLAGSMLAIFALGALFYPASLRATGIGWAAAVARVGGVLGPLAGAWVLALGVPAAEIFGLLAIPAFATALIAFSMRGLVRRLTAAEAAALASPAAASGMAGREPG